MIDIKTALLDNIRISNGPDSLRSYFHEMLHTDREKLLALLNDKNLCFSTLYVLKQEILSNSLQEKLLPQYKRALEISDEIAASSCAQKNVRTSVRSAALLPAPMRARLAAGVEKRMRQNRQDVLPSLEWIVETGWVNALESTAYETLMERCTALLMKSLRKSSILPALAGHIFNRNSEGKLIHNLVWSFFEARDPDSLYLLTQRLNSADKRDRALAKKLLHFIPGLEEASGTAAYHKAIRWLSENRPFLCYTGESMQMCSRPDYYTVSLDAKYLCRPVSADSGKPLSPLDENEIGLIESFRKLPHAKQQLLADFSCMLHTRDIYQWDSWIKLPVGRQLEAASEFTGG